MNAPRMLRPSFASVWDRMIAENGKDAYMIRCGCNQFIFTRQLKDHWLIGHFDEVHPEDRLEADK